jgi:transcription-repair coupling factor (superfamily II helicase)
LRAEVDILTLTATPIPRSLNLALSNLRDLSIIATPPSKRLAVKTFVQEWRDATLSEAIQRELRRGGQVYFLHNEVESIEKTAYKLQGLIPEARIKTAHGQMPERELEEVMRDFYHRRFNVLVCTTIIETGIDVPTANTIIINRADKFGLAQLYQLRGRVGRSHHQAYAYLITPPRKTLTADAVKRLEALSSLEELGVGFTLATHDLEIRGAGEILGDEQSGHIQEIGYSLYTRLLERAVDALKQGKQPELARPLDHGTEINLQVPALLPGDYLPDIHTRLMLYKRIASAPDQDSLEEIQVEMIDRFGLLPPAAKNLFTITGLKLKAAPLGMKKIEFGEQGGRIQFIPEPPVEPLKIIGLIQKDPHNLKLDAASNTLRILKHAGKLEERVRFLEGLVESLIG